MNDFSKEDLERLDNELEQLLEEATPVRARVSKNLSHVYSVRLSSSELRDFSRAAAGRQMTLSEFMRTATRAAAADKVDLDKAQAVSEVKQKARELNEAIERLTA